MKTTILSSAAGRTALSLAIAIALVGCASFRPTQQDAFIDGSGNVLQVQYGERTRPYTYTMVSPMNGHRIEGRDTKMVRLKKPDGEKLTGYICQNNSPKGTMYATKDGKWKYLTVGLASRLYLYFPDENDYLLVFEGSICPSAVEEDAW